LDSSVLLIQAASGLEKLMYGTKGGVLKDSTVAQISAFIYYEAQVVAKLTNNKAFQNKFKTVIFDQIDKDFGDYIDAQSRVKPKQLHHVYEWDKIGTKEARLFKLTFLQMLKKQLIMIDLVLMVGMTQHLEDTQAININKND